MENINKQFETINEILDRIDVKQKEINEKLDELIKALHAYDDDQLNWEWPEPNDALKEAALQYNEKVLNERMDIIGQNGNTGEHYEYDDYGKRVENKDKYNNTQTKHTGKKKSAIVEHQKHKSPHKH